MSTFPKGHSARTVLVRRVPTGSTATISSVKVTWHVDPSDTLTLRGIPAIGRGVAGVIRGTSPGAQT